MILTVFPFCLTTLPYRSVSKPFFTDEISSKTIEEREILSIIHQGSFERRNETYQKLLNYTQERGFISAEYIIENYLDNNNPEGNSLELQFAIHNWQELFYKHSYRVLKKNASVRGIPDPLVLDSPLEERFKWALEAIIGIKDNDIDIKVSNKKTKVSSKKSESKKKKESKVNN